MSSLKLVTAAERPDLVEGDVVPGALVPVEIDRERDLGDYREPACWMRHRI
jgi:hypothetical protein